MHKLRDVLSSAAANYRVCYRSASISALLVVFSVFITSFFVSTPTQAAQTVPYKLNFQGRLTNSSGTVVANGNYNMKLRLMSAASSGSNLWETTRSGSYRVTVTNGMFNVQLGDTVAGDPALSPSIFNTQTNATVYLEVELPTPLTATTGSPTWSEGAMTPRQLIAAAPYAMNADTIDGIDGASLAQLDTSNTFTGANLFRPSSDSTTAFQIQKSDNTPLFVADTSNLAIKIGGGDVSPNATPALFVLDHKNTSSDPTGTNGAMYYNSATGKMRCYESDAWFDCVTSSSPKGFTYSNDFTSFQTFANAINVDGTLTSGNSNASVAPVAGTAARPGIYALTINSNQTGAGGFITAYTPILFGGGIWRSVSSVMMTNLSTAADTYTARSGFYDTLTTANKVNGCYIRYTHGGTALGKWQGVCVRANTETTCDTGVTVAAGTWYTLDVSLNSAGTAATFSANGTSCSAAITTNIPTAGVGFGLDIWKSSAGFGTNQTMNVDYMKVTGMGLAR